MKLADFAAKLTAKIAATEGDTVIRTSEAALAQVQRMEDMVIKHTGFTMDTDLNDSFANDFLEIFTTKDISGEIIDGVIQPVDDNLFENIITATEEHVKVLTADVDDQTSQRMVSMTWAGIIAVSHALKSVDSFRR